MGAGQSDLYKGTYGDKAENIPDSLKGEVKLPENDAQLKHIFRNDEGHLPDTPENRKLLVELANDKKAFVGKDKWKNDWNIKNSTDGTQYWTRHMNGIINEGGKNKTQLPWNPETGLFKNVVRRKVK